MDSFRPMPSFLIVVACLAGLAVQAEAFAQQREPRASLFEEADRALDRARRARADILAPRSFEEGMKRYEAAERDLERGRNLEGIRDKLSAAAEYFLRALEAAELAEITLARALAARDDADAAEAPMFAQELWIKAAQKFEDAARELERGDVDDAREKADEAEPLFRDAELLAIKSAYLKDAWDLLRWAEEVKVAERAPRSLARAGELATRAEELLNASRYDTDEPRALAQQARIEAQHAIYVATVIKAIEDEEATFEDAMLAAEDQLRRIAGSMDIAASFESGLSATADAITRRIVIYQDSLDILRNRLADREGQVSDLEARVAELEEQLGGVEEQRTELVQRMEAQARLRQRFVTLERMFDRDEARVLREGDDVIIRLVGLTFPVGESAINSVHYDLLTKVERAISMFAGARITIEGHTDSFGSDRKNLQLSRERAEAVRRHILAGMRMDSSLIDAIGYGESRPIASNDTAEGRAKNRRTDVVIHTQEGAY